MLHVRPSERDEGQHEQEEPRDQRRAAMVGSRRNLTATRPDGLPWMGLADTIVASSARFDQIVQHEPAPGRGPEVVQTFAQGRRQRLARA